MSHLTLIRHAATDLAGTFCGHSDPPLNAQGRAQLGELLQRLAPLRLDAVWTSDLERARSTAAALATHFAVPCFERPGLREIGFGAWEGLTWAQVEAADPAYSARWVEQYPQLCAPNGESPLHFEHRVLLELDRLLCRPFERIAVVTHAGVLRTWLRLRCGLSEAQAWEQTRHYACALAYTPAAARTAPLVLR